MAGREYWESELGKHAWTKHLREVSDRKHRSLIMNRDPNDHEIACEILAEHFIVVKSLHPDAKSPIADIIRNAVEAWLEDNADEYRNQGGA